ncbi:type ISP restriction/modification enzyme [Amycolatopsis sp. NPDC049688]|uniref:type ISP restriction/modification enzyme n=1 Tax=Amycolatopsis sp. NPDC049688 TaxID=3154733 RepID=UPI00342757CB
MHDEVTISEIRSRPDIAIDSPGGRIGYIELKSPGKRTPENWRPDKHDREQWEKLQALPNIIYTDGNEWALYKRGVLAAPVGRLRGDLASAGQRLTPEDESFERLVKKFLRWRPDRPSSLRSVIAEVAPLCHLLREQVLETIEYEKSHPGRKPFTRLAMEWRNILFPIQDLETQDATFADSYAQAVTFALLLARVDGISFDGRSPSGIAEQLAKQHSLLGEALGILANSKWVDHLNVVDTLVQVIGAIDWSTLGLRDDDSYAHLYETFLADYDPSLRRHSGTYYTPALVARAMAVFVDEILKKKLHKARGFASNDVVVLDPAMGAGTFLAEVLEVAANTLKEERRSKRVPAAHIREMFAKRLAGFEIQAAPFAVAELRLHSALRNRYQVELPKDEPRFLTNALDNPDELPLDFGQLYEVLKLSRENANRIKRDVPVMVIIGNPPWRERARGAAPWLEEKRTPGKDAGRSRPSLDEFRISGQGRRAFNLNNMWTFFWRWAAWKAFEANDPTGIVALITPSAYLTSQSYTGMRRYLRQVADEGWIIDLSPEDHRADVNTRIFPATQQPICIGIFMRSGKPNPKKSARVHHMSIAGTKEQKLQMLSQVTLKSRQWVICSEDWDAAFRPGDDNWEQYPALSDIFPWQQPGVTSNRNWVWAPDRETLSNRWQQLTHAEESRARELFKETRDRTLSGCYPSQPGVPSGSLPVAKDRIIPTSVRVAFRSFDRQHLLLDRRLIDFPRPELWQSLGPRQIYTCEQHTQHVKAGPGLVFSSLVPNVDCFMGHHGGRVLPLFRDNEGTIPNCSVNLLSLLSRFIGETITAEDLLAYIAATVAHPGYTRKFNEQLKTPGIRVPLTLDRKLWREGVQIGRELIWIHTFGERFVDASMERPPGPPRMARCHRPRLLSPIPETDQLAPSEVTYDEATETLIVGSNLPSEICGRIAPVPRDVWNYTVGGMHVLGKWFDYRRAAPRYKRRTSDLDNINPIHWTAQFEDELFEMLEVLGRCVALEPRQNELLEKVLLEPLITVDDLVREGALPAPAEMRKPPRQRGSESTEDQSPQTLLDV